MRAPDRLDREWLQMLQASVQAAAKVCARQSARAREKGDLNRELQWLERASHWDQFNTRIQQKLEEGPT